MFISIFAAVLGYFAGSISSAILVCRALKLPDPRLEGSKNPGATNVLRIGGKKAAALTLIGDLLKGFLPVLLIRFIGGSDTAIALAGLGAFGGHIYPYFFEFKGGKGVATAFGALLASHFVMAICIAAIWGTVFKKTKISSLSAICAIFGAPIIATLFWLSRPLFIEVLIMVGVLLYRHRENIQRLINGEEKSFGNA